STTSYLPQLTEIDTDFPISVLDVVLLGTWNRAGALKKIDTEEGEKAIAVLASVGLEGFEHRNIGALSVGQRQKVFFARAALADAELILLDEPFTAIDTKTVDELLGLIKRWHEEGRTLIAVLHDFEQVRRYF